MHLSVKFSCEFEMSILFVLANHQCRLQRHVHLAYVHICMIHCNPSALSLHLMIITQYRMHESSRMAKTLVGNRCSPPQGTKPMIRADAGFWTNKLPIRTFDGGVLSKRFRLFNRRRFLKFLYFCSSLNNQINGETKIAVTMQHLKAIKAVLKHQQFIDIN